MIFWLVITCLALAVAALLALALLQRRNDMRAGADFDLAVYRDQLRDVDRDLARGVLSPEAAERTRLEISRRILDADRARQEAPAPAAPRGGSRAAALVVVAFIIGGSLGLYWLIGAPGYGDLPLKERIAMAQSFRENRPGQAAAEAQAKLPPPPEADPRYTELVEQLRTKVAERPDDPRGLQLLARSEANLGRYPEAYAAQERLLTLLGDKASAADYAEKGEFLILAAGGYVSPEAEQALAQALKRDPRHGPARYYTGLMFAQTGRPDLAFRYWRPLLDEGPADAPWIPAIRAQIAEIAARAGQRYTPPAAGPALPGPDGADMSAAADMSPEERQAMIRSMVERLSDRLAAEGGSPAEWSRLIGALGVLGETERAQSIYDEARTHFAADPDAMAQIRQAAEGAGLKL